MFENFRPKNMARTHPYANMASTPLEQHVVIPWSWIRD